MWEMQVLSSQRNNVSVTTAPSGITATNNNNILGKDGEMSGGSSTGGGEYQHLVGGGGQGGGVLDDRLGAGVDDMPDSPPCGGGVKECGGAGMDGNGGSGCGQHPALRGLQQGLISGCSESLLLGSCGGGGGVGINGGGGGGCLGANNGNHTCPSNCGAAVTLAANCTGNTSPVNGSTAAIGGLLVTMPASANSSTSCQSQSPPGGSGQNTSSCSAAAAAAAAAAVAAAVPGRKRPLLAGGPRASMTPTKRTVMSLLARARAAQAKHLPASAGAHMGQGAYSRSASDTATLVPVLREDFVTGAVNLNLI